MEFAPPSANTLPSAPDRERAEGLAWLLRLRWVALAAVLAAVLGAPLLGMRGMNTAVLLGVVFAGAAFNAAYGHALSRWPDRAGSPLFQALFDIGALTVTLWASGGVQNPFIALYLVHVLLVSLLSSRRAALVVCGAVLVAGASLAIAEAFPIVQISSLAVPSGIAPAFRVVAFAATVAAAGYVAQRAAAQLALRRGEAEAARRALRHDQEILLTALDRLEVGVEVLAPDGAPRFRNRHLLERRGLTTDCPRDSHTCLPSGGRCPVDDARQGSPGSCLFSRHGPGGRERIIELLSFPLGDERPAEVLRLHLDRTESVIAERRLLFAERLASLGRTAQVIAHELNTPLATIQTLATDMRAALEAAPAECAPLVRDLDESAEVIQDETRRCRAITQDLLSRGDLVSPAGPGVLCDVMTAVQRAAMIVFGSGSTRKRLTIADDLAGATASIGCDSAVQVFVNLLQNAADAIEGRLGAKVYVRPDPGSKSDAGSLAVLVDDDGPGLAAGTQDRVLEPFFTTKPPGKGTGLGLYTASALVAEAGGSLTIGDRPGGGARVRIVLPRGGST